MNHMIGHKYHVSLKKGYLYGFAWDTSPSISPLLDSPSVRFPQPKYISEAGAVVAVGLVISGIVRLVLHREAKDWLRGIR
jgi:hypothetical protein